ncbi:hypothetical protein SBF1_8170004 [Candidatus Desulfosporosinus infrequens]|uniref:Uncharacterized protein n=1 Tax=Candidatus Desulfosporosinus infrequens TaxID=2043169 RepID=A0A2U3LTZ6_9FIRM|nr:hypothetical protein SBF1_8170004 [Candidatus Desulfosporosinus infrequens]
MIPSFIVWDICVMPMSAIFTIQFKPKMNQLIKAVRLGIAGAYIIRPIATFFGF